MDCAVGAWLGHDGFLWPGSGDPFHQLHHAHPHCNFGAPHLPCDKWLGTFAATSEDAEALVAVAGKVTRAERLPPVKPPRRPT